MGSARWIETDTASNVNISAATEIGSYTADADRFIIVQALVDAIAGNGDYVMYVTLRVGGAGSAYVITPKTTMAAASGETAIGGQSGVIFVRNTDVLKVYVDGLAADTTTPDYITRFSEFAAIQPATADRSIDVDANGKVILQATQTGVTIPTVTDVTNAVKISAGTGAGQLDFTSGVVKANLAQILGTALTETAGLIAAGFKKFFNIGTPTGTVNSLPDAVPGANGGLPTTNGTKVSQTVDLTAGQTIPTVTNLTNAPADMALNSTVAKDATVSKPGTAQTITSNADITAIKAKTDNLPSDPADESLLIAAIGAVSGLDAAGVRAAVGLATANLDTQLAGVAKTGGDGDTLETLSDQIDTVDASGVADAVLDNAMSGHDTAGTLGALLNDLPDDVYTRLASIPAVVYGIPTAGEPIVVYAGDTLEFNISGLGDLTDVDEIYFTAKKDVDDIDSASIWQASLTGGLLYLNGVPAVTPGNSSVTVVDLAGGEIKVTLKAVESIKVPCRNYQYDVKICTDPDETLSKTQGDLVFKPVVTRAIT